MLIDCSYFTKGPRRILNASLGTMPNQNAIEVRATIETYIREHQNPYLARMLGSNLGDRFNAYIFGIDDDEDAERNTNIDAVCNRLRDSFADYVFFYILRDMNTQSSITGLVRLKCANEYVAPIRRQVNVWNSMVDKNRTFAKWTQTTDCPFLAICVSDDMLTKINCLNL